MPATEARQPLTLTRFPSMPPVCGAGDAHRTVQLELIVKESGDAALVMLWVIQGDGKARI